MKRAIIYNRVSTKKQQNNGTSLENQEKACRDFCKNNKIQVVGVFKEAFTGKKKSRPIFNEAIKNAKENKIDYFVVFDIDRFSREGYGIYSDLKEDLSNKGIQLKDSKNIIGEDSIVIKNKYFDMGEYKWNRENRSEMAEMVYSAQAKIEGNKIVQRTVSKEIDLEQMGYKVRQPNFGYENKKVRTSFGKATIQVKHLIEGEWIQEIFRRRAKGNLTDQEIVDDLNLKGFKSKRGKPLTVKQMQVYIKSTVYAGVISGKWTGYKPIITPYKGLVDIKTWNLANRGKIKIIEIDSKEVKIEYSNNKEIKINQPIVKNRKSYNSDYCYSKVLKCPKCGGCLTASTSRGGNGKLHYYYHCRGKGVSKHKTYSIKREETHKTISRVFRSIKPSKEVLNLFDKISKEVFEERKNELQDEQKSYIEHYKELEKKELDIINKIDKVIDYPNLLELKNKELEEVKLEKHKLKEKNNQIENITSLDKFRYYGKQLITHLDKLALQKEKPDLIRIAFEVVFDGQIEYEKLSYHTNFLPTSTAILSQQKNPSREEFPLNLKWQSH